MVAEDHLFMRGKMTVEYDEKGKIFTEIVSKIPVYATIQTSTHVMRGFIHVRRDQRIIDELDQNENFLAVTDVSVLGPEGQTLFQAPFLAVRRTHVVGSRTKPGMRKGPDGHPDFPPLACSLQPIY
jgi:hypothetical protein